MAPKGKKRPAGAREAVDAPDVQEETLPAFFDTTFTAHRISPLYIGDSSLSTHRLEAVSRHLRETLVGDVVRGVQVGLSTGDGTMESTGALVRVLVRWIGVRDLLGVLSEDDETAEDERRGGEAGVKEALAIELRYEKATFSAFLLPSLSPSLNQSGDEDKLIWAFRSPNSASAKSRSLPGHAAFMDLPLLLFRMPVPLRSVVIDFLMRTFDTRITTLRLDTRTLVEIWESWLAGTAVSRRKGSESGKNVVISLSFHIDHTPARVASSGHVEAEDEKKARSNQRGLNMIHITIPTDDVYRFVQAGRSKARRKSADVTVEALRHGYMLAGKRAGEGWGWMMASGSRAPDQGSVSVAAPTAKHPFTEALATYLDHNLALDLFHPGVRISQLACDGFVLSEGGKVKLFSPPATQASSAESSDAVWDLVDRLAQRAGARGFDLDLGLGLGPGA